METAAQECWLFDDKNTKPGLLGGKSAFLPPREETLAPGWCSGSQGDGRFPGCAWPLVCGWLVALTAASSRRQERGLVGEPSGTSAQTSHAPGGPRGRRPGHTATPGSAIVPVSVAGPRGGGETRRGGWWACTHGNNPLEGRGCHFSDLKLEHMRLPGPQAGSPPPAPGGPGRDGDALMTAKGPSRS